MNDNELVKAARDARYRGLVIKSHVEGTASRAALAKAAVWPTGDIVGGLVLNRHSVGGLNPTGVTTALRLGARVIWLPTLSSVVQRRQASGPARHALPNNAEVSGDDVEIGPELLVAGSVLGQIFAEIAKAGATLATGDLEPAMLPEVVRFAIDCGVPNHHGDAP